MKKPSYYEHGDQFPVLDLIASFRFKSAGSVSFALETESDTLERSDGTSLKFDSPMVFNIIGSLDIHYPCDDHIKVYVRTELPARYHSYEQMQQFVKQVFWQLAIPPDETYEAYFVSVDHQSSIEQATDRNGLSDRIY